MDKNQILAPNNIFAPYRTIKSALQTSIDVQGLPYYSWDYLDAIRHFVHFMMMNCGEKIPVRLLGWVIAKRKSPGSGQLGYQVVFRKLSGQSGVSNVSERLGGQNWDSQGCLLVDCVKYFCDRSARDCTQEEKELLEEEMDCTVCSFYQTRNAWNILADNTLKTSCSSCSFSTTPCRHL